MAPAGDDSQRWIDANHATGAWHYREWQWWRGHPWGESCRPRYFADVALELPSDDQRRADLLYAIDGFDCRQIFLAPKATESDAPYCDLLTTVRNSSGGDVHEYGQFFACYTPLGRGRSFWYWDESDKLMLMADRGIGHLDGYIAHPDAYFLEQKAIPHCPRGEGKIVGRWRHPVLVSHASPAGWRSIILIESQRAAGLAQGLEGGAMDYILFPEPHSPTFPNQSAFSAHIRHVMLKSPELPSVQRLRGLWDEFERAHDSVRQSAE